MTVTKTETAPKPNLDLIAEAIREDLDAIQGADVDCLTRAKAIGEPMDIAHIEQDIAQTEQRRSELLKADKLRLDQLSAQLAEIERLNQEYAEMGRTLGVALLEYLTTNYQPNPGPFTAEEAATKLRTTVQGVYALVKRGRLHPMPGSPGKLLFTDEAINRCLTTRRRK